MRSYQEQIRDELTRKGYVGMYDPRHIEAFMRLQYSTLDHLSKQIFNKEIELCRQCVNIGGSDNAEFCAQSFGL